MEAILQLQKFAEGPIATSQLLSILQGYQRPYDKIDSWVQKGILVQLRRGLYTTSPKLAARQPEAFLLANHLYGPSYVSMESALHHWQLIPERVYGVSSATFKPSKRFDTPKGKFNFTHLPLPYYSFGMLSVTLQARQTALLASPEKALCDTIITSAQLQLRSKKATRAYLLDDMRIELADLRQLDAIEIKSWLSHCPKQNTIHMLIQTLDSL